MPVKQTHAQQVLDHEHHCLESITSFAQSVRGQGGVVQHLRMVVWFSSVGWKMRWLSRWCVVTLQCQSSRVRRRRHRHATGGAHKAQGVQARTTTGGIVQCVLLPKGRSLTHPA